MSVAMCGMRASCLARSVSRSTANYIARHRQFLQLLLHGR